MKYKDVSVAQFKALLESGAEDGGLVDFGREHVCIKDGVKYFVSELALSREEK